ncbi:MAG: glutamate synthase large subunit [Proteobacteria bacterium]|nr:glutamate synthase large subunit [Pseudomonadota bacterium]
MRQLSDGSIPSLYLPETEHDACGIGFLARLDNVPTHDLIEKALSGLHNLDHRGASGCDPESGDGAGVLIQVPDRFLRSRADQLGITLPPAREYGVGMLFLPREAAERSLCEEIVASAARSVGLEVLGWREVPFDEQHCGSTSLTTRPDFAQVFVGKNGLELDEESFERKLYTMRKVAENKAAAAGGASARDFYPSSLSCRTLVYKGMLLTGQLSRFYPDLAQGDMESALALVHSRFSTNTLPAWSLAQPFRYMCHNGEINTLRGNINWMNAREKLFESSTFGPELERLLPIVKPGQSDSATLDNALELLFQTGRELPHAAMMMVPEAWEKHDDMDQQRRDFYRYHGCLLEPWDGPACIPFTDGHRVGAILDRNGLRPSRYLVTKDGLVIVASETGVIDVAPENVERKGRLQPGRIFLVDLDEHRIIDDEEAKAAMAARLPWGEWLERNVVELDELPEPGGLPATITGGELKTAQKLHGYTREELKVLLLPMARDGQEPLGSMGTDTPLAVLSNQPQLLYNYFKQLFAQVTNPPIDPIREELIMSLDAMCGRQQNLFDETEDHCRQLHIPAPCISNDQLARIREIDANGIHSTTLDCLFDASGGEEAMDEALQAICNQASGAVKKGFDIIILSDRAADAERAPIPALLAVGAVHHHLIREGSRTLVGLVVESGEVREVMHFCLLSGYGASAVNPWLAMDTLNALAGKGALDGVSADQAVDNYCKAIGKGLLKTMSKMGISTQASYRGAQIFEAIGLAPEVIERCFFGTASRIGGIGLDLIAEESRLRHDRAYGQAVGDADALETGGEYQWRRRGEYHLFNPETVSRLQLAVRSGDYEVFGQYSKLVNEQSSNLCTLRGLMSFRSDTTPVPLDEVEAATEIVKRFKTGAMSYGSISREAHENLAIAMNRIGGRSNTGEGGENPERFKPMANGDSASSAIKQVASGRFGVTINYLSNAKELQIKMAQGAKPGEGGQLPGHKVNRVIARTRYSTPGVGLISPPPHHDIYSIEDLAQLIHDLKNSNPTARVSVKLVSEVGVGTIAAGVSKAKADVVLISGHDGGTGASPLSSIKYAGAPWELGLAETQQVLVDNDLRSRIRVETDGQLKTGRDVAVAAMLGADEFGFATAALVAEGCIMMRKCHLNTCPVGIATQDESLRKKFSGTPEQVINFMMFVAEELREIMAAMGVRSVQELTGRVDLLNISEAVDHWKARGLDLAPILARPPVLPGVGISGTGSQDHGLDKALDNKIIQLVRVALDEGKPVAVDLPIANTNRTVCTTLSHEITKKYGEKGLPDHTINLNFTGSAGQSFGAFMAPGITAHIHGDANDYFCKGMSGGQVSIAPQAGASFVAEDNIIIGNVAFYGATAGEVFVRGQVGERCCVRNSGVTVVVEGVGDHGCEYMTGGRLLCLGATGRNFAAGMSGGFAYVLDVDGRFAERCNMGMVELFKLDDPDEAAEVKQLVQRHVQLTGSELAKSLLGDWSNTLVQFIKVFPSEYRRVLEETEKEKSGAAARASA